MTKKKTKVAIIGAGRWGKNLLKEFNEQAEVIWCVYKDNEETKKFLEGTYPHIKITNLYEDVLKDHEVEVVVLATPTPTHFEIAQKVLEANKHLFLEKPGCSNSTELEKLCGEAEKRNLTFAVGYEFVHHPVWKKIRELMSMDDIRSMHFEWFKWGTFVEPTITNLLCHDIAVMVSLGQEVKNTQHFMHMVISPSDILESTFDCGTLYATSYINRVSGDKRKTVTVIGEKNTYIWNNDSLSKIDFETKTLSSIEISPASPVSEEIRDFLTAISQKGTPITNGKFALKVYRLLEKISVS